MRLLWGVMAAFLVLGGSAIAQPAEPPPADYTGSEYTDSRGCSFVRAELGTQTMWAARTGADGQPVCAAPEPAPQATVDQPRRTVARPPAPARPVEFPRKGGYVQVATLDDLNRAKATSAALKERGYRVFRQDLPRRSGAVRVLYVGPFQDRGELREALRTVRAMGFSDAFIRIQD